MSQIAWTAARGRRTLCPVIIQKVVPLQLHCYSLLLQLELLDALSDADSLLELVTLWRSADRICVHTLLLHFHSVTAVLFREEILHCRPPVKLRQHEKPLQH